MRCSRCACGVGVLEFFSQNGEAMQILSGLPKQYYDFLARVDIASPKVLSAVLTRLDIML